MRIALAVGALPHEELVATGSPLRLRRLRLKLVTVDEVEARELLAAEVERLRAAPYRELLRLREAETFERIGRSGACYQVEVQSFWDDRPSGDLRVIVAIDDGGWSAISPMSDDFIMAPDGGFVSE